jgi:hypothetical protein
MSSEHSHHTSSEPGSHHNHHDHPKGSKWWTAIVGITLLSLVIIGIYLGVNALFGQ